MTVVPLKLSFAPLVETSTYATADWVFSDSYISIGCFHQYQYNKIRGDVGSLTRVVSMTVGYSGHLANVCGCRFGSEVEVAFCHLYVF